MGFTSKLLAKTEMVEDLDHHESAPKSPTLNVGDKVHPKRRGTGVPFEVVSIDGDKIVLKSPSGFGNLTMDIADLDIPKPPPSIPFGLPRQRSQKSLDERAAPYIKKVVDHLEQYAGDIAAEIYEQFRADFDSRGSDVRQDQDVDNAIVDSITDAVIDYMDKIRVPEELSAIVQQASVNKLHYPGGRS